MHYPRVKKCFSTQAQARARQQQERQRRQQQQLAHQKKSRQHGGPQVTAHRLPLLSAPWKHPTNAAHFGKNRRRKQNVRHLLSEYPPANVRQMSGKCYKTSGIRPADVRQVRLKRPPDWFQTSDRRPADVRQSLRLMLRVSL